MGDYAESIFLARVAEQADRFDDMFKHLKNAVKLKKQDLGSDERNLLSVGFKNLIGTRRTALRNIAAIAQNPKYTQHKDALDGYRNKIQSELFQQCMDIINLTEDHILPNCVNVAESRCYFYKMVADYYRYMAESAKEEKLEEVSNKALEYYEKATNEANNLEPYSPIRLGLALNFSVFYFEVRDNKDEAIKLAEDAHQKATEDPDALANDQYRDSAGIIELLKENLELWKEEDNDDNN